MHEKDDLNNGFIPIMVDLRGRINSYFQIELSDSELGLLQQYFMAKQFIYGTNINNIKTEESINVVNQFLQILTAKFNINVIDNPVIRTQ